MKEMSSNARAKKPFDSSWGSDLDPSRRPGVPKELNVENGSSGHAAHWPRITRQHPEVKIFQTIERPGLTPVFGTVRPPRGVSGLLRAGAYRYSEDKLRHWMMLVLSDRIDMVEGWVEDIFRGRMPMLLSRMEFRTADKLRNPKARAATMRNLAILAGAAGLVAYWVISKRGGGKLAAYKPPRDFPMYESTPDLP